MLIVKLLVARSTTNFVILVLVALVLDLGLELGKGFLAVLALVHLLCSFPPPLD